LTHVDAGKFSPAPKFWFEAVLKAAAGQNISVKLYDKTNAAYVAGAVVSSASTAATIVRSVGSFTLSGAAEYQFRVLVSGGTGTLYQVKLQAMQQYPTAAPTQVRIASYAERTQTSFAESGGAARWQYDKNELDGIDAVYFETVGNDGGAGTAGEARLVKTDGTVIATNTMTSAITRTRSADIKGSLNAGDVYYVEIKANTVNPKKTQLYQARIVIEQSSMTRTVNYVDLSWKTTTTAAAHADLGYDARYHADSEFGGYRYFEVTKDNSHASGWAGSRLEDNTAAAVVAGSDQAQKGQTKTRVRSADLNAALNSQNGTYSFQGNASRSTSTFYDAFLISHVNLTRGHTFDHPMKTTTPAAGTCTWSFSLEYVGSSNLGRLRNATISLRGSATQDQIKWDGASITQTSGTAATVTSGSDLVHLVSSNPSSSGSSQVDADLKGTCGGLHTVQRAHYVLG
jgi:hypothetical protein